MAWKGIRLLVVAAAFAAVGAGCATNQDLKRLQAEVHQRTSALEDRIALTDQSVASVRTGAEKTGEALGAVRKTQAELGADMTEMRDGIQQLRGAVEALRKDVAALSARAGRKDDEIKDVRSRLDRVAQQAAFIETFLGLGKKDEAPAPALDKVGGGAAPRDLPRGKSDKETAYAAAYDLFKERKYDRARTEFQNFLKQFPDTEYSDNAQFWIGECYYFEGSFEKAILEYDKAIKNYPEGDKTSYALLKQGLAFERLGDKASARLILQQVIKDYPNTNQARIARAKLMEIK